MTAQEITTDRREHPRCGVIRQLEDITYAALRRHGLIEGDQTEPTNSSAQPPVTIH